jgi:Protein of unknown function (DUF3099)
MEGMPDRRRGDDAIRITTATRSAAEDTSARQRRYLISMAIRTLCVVGAVVVGPGWFRWVLVAGAVALPQVAVIAANAVDRRSDRHELVGPTSSRELPGRTDPDRLS